MMKESIPIVLRRIKYKKIDGILYDEVTYEDSELLASDRWSLPAQTYLQFFDIPLVQDLVTGVDALIEKYPTVDRLYFLEYFFREENGIDNAEILRFLLNNYFPKVDKINHIRNALIEDFYIKTKTLGGNDKKAAFERFMNNEDLDTILKSYEKEEFDLSILDQLDGKITDEKMVNWGVGQIMKAHPKKYNPADIKEAITKRFL